MSKKTNISLTKMEKVLLVMYEMSKTKTKFKYEDIVVQLYKKFKDDFQLRGYPQYPDSGDSTQRSFYTLKQKGLMISGNKTFGLTDKGIDFAKKISAIASGKKIYSKKKLDRYAEKELERIMKLDGLKQFVSNNLNNILDTDLFDYLGATVRSSKSTFSSRFDTISEIIRMIEKEKGESQKLITKYHHFIIKKFKNEIEYKLNND